MKAPAFFFIFVCLLLAITSCRQDSDILGYRVDVNGQFEYLDIDEPPVFNDGGQEGLSRALLEVLTYPAEARDNGVEGCVELEYEVTETGEVENVTVLTDPGTGLGDAAKEALESVTDGASFTPAMLFGEPVRVLLQEEVCFDLG